MEEEYNEELEKLLGEIPRATSAPPHLEEQRTAVKDHHQPSSKQSPLEFHSAKQLSSEQSFAMPEPCQAKEEFLLRQQRLQEQQARFMLACKLTSKETLADAITPERNILTAGIWAFFVMLSSEVLENPGVVDIFFKDSALEGICAHFLILLCQTTGFQQVIHGCCLKL
ncbi:hypothetical protein GOP47_0001760 [Adiantum capillus-veneris]|uniref:Uncharacterized protein n=1 Tax=Adiantum capillus-veneris TaxID=13818 RepID=A0A9D4VAP2_ADICA|nr:hypothetical protein GOP47_0001760 [Adiantum capillus-veneris]